MGILTSIKHAVQNVPVLTSAPATRRRRSQALLFNYRTESNHRRIVRQRAISEPVASEKKTANVNDKRKTIDDLTRIEGIGPKVCALLVEHGITQYSQLARVPVDTIRDALSGHGRSFAMIDPQSWPVQAALAATGQWDALQSMQKHLNGGRVRGTTPKTLRVKCVSAI